MAPGKWKRDGEELSVSLTKRQRIPTFDSYVVPHLYDPKVNSFGAIHIPAQNARY
ncbi:hypothetical protein M3J09_010979 [Ascochyta lentis]